MAKKQRLTKEQKALQKVENKQLEDLLEEIGIDQWDFILIGDGSGSSFDHECGWGSVAIDRITLEPPFPERPHHHR
jgi:hypothetical protein